MTDLRSSCPLPLTERKKTYSNCFAAAGELFSLASHAAGGEVIRNFNIGGFTIQLRFAGAALVSKITPALEHLSAPEDGPVDLEVRIFDSISTGVEMPGIPWEVSGHPVTGEIWSYDDGDLAIIFQPANSTVSMLSRSGNRAVYWVRDAEKVPYHDRGSPLRMILERWMRSRGFQVVHSGAVGYPRGGVLLAGRGGSGKSTTTLACIGSGLSYAADDYCLLSGDPEPQVFSLYNTGKLNEADIDRFPLLRPALSNTSEFAGEKALYFFYRHFPDRIAAGFPVRAILIPEITHRTGSGLTRVSPSRGFLALAPTTVFQLPGPAQEEVNRSLSAFVRSVPNYILELGTNIDLIPGVISELLNSL